MAENILRKYKLPEGIIEEVKHAVISHRFRNDLQPKTIEAKVLFDADKIDSIGAVGIGRAFLFAGNAGSGNMYTGREKELAKLNNPKKFVFTKEDSAVLEYEVKLKYVKDKVLTLAGKKIAFKRDKFMREFFKQFWLEVEGKR
ncbi:MAG TPA: hypothetical protein GX706_03690 [Candidatus Moranbacteria bacterium]|nr:hypothetical protein [Candidatus Moranbacteria bacterium]